MQTHNYSVENLNEKNKEPQKYYLIETIKECVKIVEEILSNQKILALDCEGIYLSREGKLTLIQV